jgi:protein TonB
LHSKLHQLQKKDPDAEIQLINPVGDSNDQSHSDTSKVYTSVDQSPEFPGGIAAFQRYLAVNIRYPAKAFEEKKQGKVFVQFTIGRDGAINDVKVVRSVSPEIDEEALRVVKNSPKWRPGKLNGIPVKVYYTIPINFSLSQK